MPAMTDDARHGVLRFPAAGQGPDGIHGHERGQGEERDGDDPQRQVLAPLGVLGGELPGQCQCGRLAAVRVAAIAVRCHLACRY